MARPKGIKNRPGSKKPGRKPGCTSPVLPQYRDEEVRRFKERILELFESGEAENLSQAADRIGVSKIRVYGWRKADRQWCEDLSLVSLLIADKYEQELLQPDIKYARAYALVVMLNATHPEKFRKDYKVLVTSPKVEALLEKLKEAGRGRPAISESAPVVEETKTIAGLIEMSSSKDGK